MEKEKITTSKKAYVITTENCNLFIGYGIESAFGTFKSVHDAILFPEEIYATRWKNSIIEQNPRSPFTKIIPVLCTVSYYVE